MSRAGVHSDNVLREAVAQRQRARRELPAALLEAKRHQRAVRAVGVQVATDGWPAQRGGAAQDNVLRYQR